MKTGFPTPRRRFETLGAALKTSIKQPALGVTQGGSSKKGKGARVAARDANIQRKASK